MLASFFPMVTMVNENGDYWRWFCHCQNCEDCQKLGFRYLTVTMCGNACPCPDSVVVTLFWIGKKLKAIFFENILLDLFSRLFQLNAEPGDLRNDQQRLQARLHWDLEEALLLRLFRSD